MREIRLYEPPKRHGAATTPVTRVQFDHSGEQLFAWSGYTGESFSPRDLNAPVVFAHALSAGNTRQVWNGNPFQPHESERAGPVVSPDARYLIAQFVNADMVSLHRGRSVAWITALTGPDKPLVELRTGFHMPVGFAFTPDGASVIAVRNPDEHERNALSPRIARFATAELIGPPNGSRPVWRSDPPVEFPVRRITWRSVMTVPGEDWIVASALSADGHRLALATRDGTVRVVDLKRKSVLASFSWPIKQGHLRWVEQLAFDPAGEQVAVCANGKLGVHALANVGKGWHTKRAMAPITAIAYHPAGNVLAVACEDGCARFLDPRTGSVAREYRWKRGPLYSIGFAADGLLAAAGAGGARIILWDVDA